jgi:hypothetical protein
MLVPCIAVIDEDDGGYCNHKKWDEFRDAYPHRPFGLLLPRNYYDDDQYDDDFYYLDMGIPPNAYDDPLFQVHYVRRDYGYATADNWFDLCGLRELGPANVKYIGLFVDNSGGSMHKGNVENSYNKFLADVSEAGGTICEVHNGDEDWIKPFMTTLTPTSGQCVQPKPYEETSWPTAFPTLSSSLVPHHNLQQKLQHMCLPSCHQQKFQHILHHMSLPCLLSPLSAHHLSGLERAQKCLCLCNSKFEDGYIFRFEGKPIDRCNIHC